ncbi:toxic anion resistance protein [Enterovibrio sp. ZSDZ42]|uniref:Toxic anion resistance protein n=1 Tax=Enterovibrio gelatinilyticus TaxID=2899819 RepID=A0ABT5QXP7_9GAMM|nr:toxic anion resistance protein [Enterovibrio sp. ZSDZ42]MDD1792311.1 toxic anion resistance protein [Enterovibrio sp. ZSDZ42]
MTFKPKTFTPKSAVQPQVVTSTPVTIDADSSLVVDTSLTSSDLPSIDSRAQLAVENYKQEISEAKLDSDTICRDIVSQLNKIDVYSSDNISDLGQSSAVKINEYSDSMLSHVRTNDLEDMGNNLNQVIGLAKNVDVSALIGKKGMFGKIVSKIRNTKESILAQFNSVTTQLDRVVNEINAQQSKLKERSSQLDTVYNHNVDQFRSLTLSIVYGEARSMLMQDKIESLAKNQQEASSALLAQELSDLQTTKGRLEKRVHDLKSLQLLSLQTAPMIRMVQNNNLTLVEKFDNIKMLTIPSWKKQFTLAISLLEQKKSVELANKIDDATNDLIKKNADLLKQNTLQTAQANQRSTIDIETLEHVQNTLITTLEDVVSIEQEGARNRLEADAKMVNMKSELTNFLKQGRGNN